MKKLLFINGHMDAGGVEKSLLDILRHLDYSTYEVDLLLLERIGDYGSEIPEQVHIYVNSLEDTYGSPVQSLLRCIQKGNWTAFRIRLILLVMKLFGQRWIRLAGKLLTGDRQYDCVIGFRPGVCTQVAAFAAKGTRRLTWWHHGAINVDRGYPECASVCDQVVVVSEACRRMLAEAFPALEDRLEVIPNMVDVEVIRRKAKRGHPYTVEPGLLHLVTLCRLSPEKHVENVFPAVQRLKDIGLSFQWHIVGGGASEVLLQQEAEAAGITDVVCFEGNQPDPYPYLGQADLFVHPSYVESQGLVVLEAMALGVPCVVTRSLGPCEFIQDGVNGVLTEQDPSSLAEKVEQMLTDPELYARIKKNTHCPRQFLPEQVMEQIDRLLGGDR